MSPEQKRLRADRFARDRSEALALSSFAKAAAALAEARDTFGVEADRLRGFALAMGAAGLYHLAAADPELRAAAVAEAMIGAARKNDPGAEGG